jgi:flagellar motility protein MotE (MotC chaperone)
MKFLQSSWLVSLIGCLVYLTTTAAVLSSAKFEAETSEVEDEAQKFSPGNDPSWKFRNPEFEQWVADLRQEKAAFEVRKAQLTEWETRLVAESQELSTVTQKVAQLQAEFERNVVRLKEQEVKNLKRQAKAVADMTPDTAATMLDQMTDDDIVRLFSAMKNEQVTLLLETLSKQGKVQTRRAAAITERMRHLLPADSATPSTPAP